MKKEKDYYINNKNNYNKIWFESITEKEKDNHKENKIITIL